MAGGVTRGLALCAGVGGLELGISAALPGYRAVCHVENEAYAAAVLAQRMEAGDLPPACVYSDLRTFDGRPWAGVVDLVSAGSPCQPFSVAGTRKGKDDPRHLWPHVMRVVREVGPRVVCLENVRGHLSLGFAQVLGDLASAGFSAEWGVFSAEEVGAPHRRERLFILAHASGADLRDEQERRGGASGERAAKPGNNGPAERWPALPPICGSAYGAPYRVDRLRALGNAVVPAQAAHAFRVLAWRAGL